MLVSSYLLALLTTILVEVSVAVLFGCKSKEVLSIVLVNLITQPVLNYIVFLVDYFKLVYVDIQFVFFSEIIVILVEWRLLVFALERSPRRLFVLSLVMNLASFLVGLLLFW